jgi:hypothetical protein
VARNRRPLLRGKKRIRPIIIISIAIFVLPLLASSIVWARPTTPDEAEQVVMGWLLSDAQPLGTAIGNQVISVQSITNHEGEPIYYAVTLWPSGFVIVPADDLLEPIVGFGNHGTYHWSPHRPLAGFVSRDLNGRIASVRPSVGPQILTVSPSHGKWQRFISLAETAAGGLAVMSVPSISDVRVAPLVQSTWGQGDVCGENCFNYYTPNHYYCGCVATAMAQLMRYHQHPVTGIGIQDFVVTVDGDARTAYTRGGNGLGSHYFWSSMVLEPDCQTTETQRQAIAALCYDASISIGVDYGPDGSSGDVLQAKDALTATFMYSNAINGYSSENDIGPGLLNMINPNLDAGHPVILGLCREDGGHAVVCDGYGYQSATPYHHLNMGWGGFDDVWYNLPNVDAHYPYTSVAVCVYNIFASGTGEIISGRITAGNGTGLGGVTVTAKSAGRTYTAATNDRGIYALVPVPAASLYTVSAAKEGYQFADRVVRTGRSRDWSDTSGNKWQIDFVADLAGDCDADGDVDAEDFATFARAWLTKPGNAGWNACCDISVPRDNFVDTLDLVIFLDNWLTGVQ